MSANVTVDVSKLVDLSNSAALDIVDAAARELAFAVLQQADNYLEQQVYTRPNVQVTAEKMGHVPEPTGALWNSGYVRSFTGELPPGCRSEQEALSAAQSKNGDVTFGQAPPGPAKLGHAQVLYAVEYALYVEMGTVLGMVPRPYLEPAAANIQSMAEKFVVAKLKQAGF